MLRFGTDGVRGVANLDLTPELALALGRAAARVLGGRRFLVGRDTRRSGPLLEGALVAGLASEGAGVGLLGVAPTPAAAWLAAADGVPAAVISASHNPFADNGVKLFSAQGAKLDDLTEAALEAELEVELRRPAGRGQRPGAPTGAAVGEVTSIAADLRRWADAVRSSIGGRSLGGLRVVIDCANGAASASAPEVLSSLGAQIVVLNARPDGCNINEGCGSTHPAHLQREVLRAGAQVGIAFDGDADRALAVDERGGLVDGDQLIAMCAIDRHRRGKLAGGAVVVTSMSNQGLRLGMARHGIAVVEVPVGDRQVLAALDARGLVLGGEQSGHIVFRDLASTGDGLLTAVQVLDLVARSGRTLSALASSAMQRLPQALRNVAVQPGQPAALAAVLVDEAARVEAELGGAGRVLIRPSGTEPVVRVMVEATTEERAAAAADHLAERVRAASIGASADAS